MSRTSVTSAIPCAARLSEPAQMTSSALRERSARPCSPSAQRSASARLLLPEPFGPDDRADPAAELDVGPLGERLEALEAEGEQARRRRSRRGRSRCRRSCADRLGPLRWHRSRSIASAAAAVSAVRATDPRRRRAPRRRPRPRSGTSSRGPARSRRAAGTTGRPPVVRWVYSWSRLLGLLRATIGASALELRSGQLDQPVADRLEAEVEVERPDERLERRREQRRPAPAAAPGLALAEQQRRAEVDPPGQPRQARSSRRSRRGAPTGRPRRRRDGGCTAPRR